MNKKLEKLKNKDEVLRFFWREISKLGLLNFLPDKTFINLEYRLKMKSKLNLESPKTYNEKLQWLKLNDRKPLYTQLVDKYEVREYVEKIIGEEFLIPIYGVYESYEEINFDNLPDQFVLKPTHTSGDVFLCKDKSKIDHNSLKNKVQKWLKKDYYNWHREWPYKNIKPRIICEKFMVEKNTNRIKDYKFFCFDGKPELMFIASDRGENTRFDFYDMSFDHLKVKQHYPKSEASQTKPANYEDMKVLAEKLSKGFPHVRIDLYSINGKIYFGEFTFYHFSGFEPFEPSTFDYKFGSYLNLPR